MEVSDRPEWRVLIVEPRKHALAADFLSRARVPLELFNPLYQDTRIVPPFAKDRPLFPGYIFARFLWEDHVPILTAGCVQRILSFEDGPATVRDEEIAQVRLMMLSDQPVTTSASLVRGQKVVVIMGPLIGLAGELVGTKGTDFIAVNLEMMGSSCHTRMRRDMVRAA